MKSLKMYDYENSPYVALAQLVRAIKDGNTPGKSVIIERLLKRGLQINYAIPPDGMVSQHKAVLVGWTPLHFATNSQDEEAMNIMIQHGAKVTSVNNFSYSPIRLAVENPWKESLCFTRMGRTEHGVVEWLLKVQLAQNDTANPTCKLGISHLHIACIVNDSEVVGHLLRSGSSIEAAISPHSPVLAGYRPIHVVVRYGAFDSMRQLLHDGPVDLWSREARGFTPLQLLMECNIQMAEALQQFDDAPPMPLVATGLSYEAIANLILACGPIVNEHGLQRLHVAATMWNINMLMDTLEGNPNVDINAAISEDSPIWPGYTPLHFAALCGIKPVKVLLENGADLFRPDPCGITPFDLCFDKYEPKVYYEIMSYDQRLKNVTFEHSPNATLCDAMKALQNVDGVRAFLGKLSDPNDRVSLDSPLWPGCTLLHLAVVVTDPQSSAKYFSNLSEKFGCPVPTTRNWDSWGERLAVLDFLQHNGADPIAQDVRNFTPLHMAFRQNKLTAAKRLLGQLAREYTTLDNVTDEDGLSLLHISCVMGNSDVVDTLLLNNADVNARTISPLRLKWCDSTSTFDFFLNSGSTPLHTTIASKSWLIDFLIQRGADLLAMDDEGYTPTLLSFVTRPAYYARVLTRKLISAPSVLMTDVVSVEGLSYFHIACWSNAVTAVETFLRKGVDINAQITCCPNHTYADIPHALKGADHYMSGNCENLQLYMAPYAGNTPLHFAMDCSSVEVISLLVAQGADVNLKNAQGISPLLKALANDSNKAAIILGCLLSSEHMSEYKPSENYGITLLHIACWQQDIESVKRQIRKGCNVNAQISMSSPVWPGETALNLLINGRFNSVSCTEQSDIDIILMVSLLLQHGADVTIPNSESITPIHAVANLTKRGLTLLRFMLIKSRSNYDVNQMNLEGLSFLHIACLANNLELVTKLCNQGADINRPTDYFSIEMGGFSPLHFAALNEDSSVVEYLLQRGANVNAIDYNGCTPLHVFCQHGEDTLNQDQTLLKLCEYGADIDGLNVHGKSPLEILLQRPYAKTRVVALLHCGARLNTVNPVSGSSLICGALSKRTGYSFKEVLSCVTDSEIHSVTDDGATIIHNSVRGCVQDNFISYQYYASIIEELLKKGCDINALDNSGSTALHVAVSKNNYMGVRSLLTTGINANIVNHDGCTAFNLNANNRMVYLAIMMHLHKLVMLGLHMCEQNRELYLSALSFPPNEANFLQAKLESEVKVMETFQLHGSFTLRDLMTESAISDFALMPRKRRKAIMDHLASSEIYEMFPNMDTIIRYQYRRLLEREDLIEPAKKSLVVLVHNSLPNYCLEKIITYIDNQELKTLILVDEIIKSEKEDFIRCKRAKLNAS